MPNISAYQLDIFDLTKINFNQENNNHHKRCAFTFFLIYTFIQTKYIDILTFGAKGSLMMSKWCVFLSSWSTGRPLLSEGEEPSWSGWYRLVHLERFWLLLSEEGQHDDPTQKLQTASVTLNQARPMSSGSWRQPANHSSQSHSDVGMHGFFHGYTVKNVCMDWFIFLNVLKEGHCLQQVYTKE